MTNLSYSDLNNLTDIELTSVDADVCYSMSAIQEEIDNQVKAYIDTEATTVSGHIYPVNLVTSWTRELQAWNAALQRFLDKYALIDLTKVDKSWLKERVTKFANWISDKLAKLRTKIVNGLKSMSSTISDAISLFEPVVNMSLSADTVVSWAGNVISFFSGPYGKLVQFVTDFATYTPPLIVAATQLTATVVTAPVRIIAKTSELDDEGSSVVREEIESAVGQITFPSISLGDLS